MNPAPVFAVVGHPNKGKSSVVATLSQNDAIAIALEPGTTRRRQAYPMRVDGRLLYTLVDTPGFQRPRRVLEWLEAHSVSASDRAATVRAFVVQYRDSDRFVDECELLAPLIEGAGIIYVVDGSVPYGPQHEAEMTILRWTGCPSLALINSIGDGDHGDAWQAALRQFFQVVRRFDALRAPFEEHLSLLRAFGQMEPAWEQPLAEAVAQLSRQRQHRRQQAAGLIAMAVQDMMAYQYSRTLGPGSPTVEEGGALAETLQRHWYQHQRQREQDLRQSIERLYQHQHLQRREAELAWHSEHDLFSEGSRRLWGVGKAYLASAGFGAGALGGAGIDALTLGSSLGAATLLGGLIGAAGSYLYGDRLALSALHIEPLQDGIRTARFGPVQDNQFGYIVLGRAVHHWWQVSQRNHAGRDTLELAPDDSHWLEDLDRTSRNRLHATFDQARRGRPLDGREQQNLVQAVEQALEVYDRWRVRRLDR